MQTISWRTDKKEAEVSTSASPYWYTCRLEKSPYLMIYSKFKIGRKISDR